MKRYGQVLRVREGTLAEYERLHAAVWPEVLARLAASHVHNYTIFERELDDGRRYLFAYFEYTGSDFAADMRAVAADPATQRWWALCEPCQEPLANRDDGEWWLTLREIFHAD